jgi:hypothetical protein
LLLDRKNPIKRDFPFFLVSPGHLFEFSLPWKRDFILAIEFGIFLDYETRKKAFKFPGVRIAKKKE